MRDIQVEIIASWNETNTQQDEGKPGRTSASESTWLASSAGRVSRESQRAQPKLYAPQKCYAGSLMPAVQPFGKDDSKAGVIEDAYVKLLVSSDLFKCSQVAIN
jgi:hypothetical protein